MALITTVQTEEPQQLMVAATKLLDRPNIMATTFNISFISAMSTYSMIIEPPALRKTYNYRETKLIR